MSGGSGLQAKNDIHLEWHWRMKVGGNNKNNRSQFAGRAGYGAASTKSGADIFNGKKRYFTTSQLMTRWGVSAPTVIRLIEEGHLRGLKIRGAYRVDRDSIELYEKKVAF